MLNLGQTEDERKAYRAALHGRRRIRTRLDILDIDGKPLRSIEQRMITGDVAVDGRAEVSRSLNVSLYDPNHVLRLDSDAPEEGALYADRMVRAVYLVRVPGGWEEVPVFTGPITKLDRDEAVVTVECQGKESLALGGVWTPLSLEKGLNKVDAIRRIMRERAGETKFDFPEGKQRLASPVALGREDSAWAFAQRIAKGMDKQLFYDARGRLRLRNLPQRTGWAFGEAQITSVPQVSFDIGETRNAVRVTGRVLHAGKEEPAGRVDSDLGDDNIVSAQQIPTLRTGAVAVAERSHPLSPWRLGRVVNGEVVPRYIPEFITDDTVRSNKEAKALAQRVLNDRLRQAVSVSFDTMVVPHIEPGDMMRVLYGDFDARARLWQFGFSLTTDGSMSVGYHRRVSRPARPRRQVNRK